MRNSSDEECLPRRRMIYVKMNPPFDSNPHSNLLKFRYIYYGQVGGEDRMQRIQVHPDVLEEKARLVQQKKLELERMVRELEKSIYLLQSEWSGVTGERFFWDFMQVKEVFPATLGLLDKIQNEFIFIAKNFRTADGSGEVALYIPEELKRNFGVGLLDKSVGETVTGMGQTAEALFYDPFGTVASVAYGLTLGKVVDVGRGIKFAWDAAWGNGTARSDVGQFVDEQKKQVNESGAGYYSGSVMGQVLAYAFVGKALRTVENKHSDLGGSGGGKLHTNGTPSPTHNANGDRIDNAEVSKVKEPSSVSEFMRQEDLAFDMYGAFKKLKNDTSDIARNTGWKESDIQQIKDHLFFEKHKFDSGEIKSFDPNYQQALAWERLMKGSYNKNDILLLNHELFESNYIKKYGVTYEKAHSESQKHYNWSDSVYE